MTKYRITRYAGESQPCAIADPAGCFYSTGEVDRKIEELKQTVLEISDGGLCLEDMKALIKDMIAWFKWFQPYPSTCVLEFIARGSKFGGLEDEPDEDIHSR